MSASRLLSLAEILPAGLEPVTAIEVPTAEALGAIAGEDVIVPEGWPRAAIAREPGYAVRARMLIGATAYEPALLPASTPLLAVGDKLPDGADAILPAQAVVTSPMGLEAFSTLRPGEGIRRAGQDFPAGGVLLRAGSPIGAIEQALLGAMQIPAIRVRRLGLSLDAGFPQPVRDLLSPWALALGLALAAPEDAQIRLESADLSEPRLALRPGRFGRMAREGNAFALAVPPDLAEAIGIWHGVVLPLCAALLGATLHNVEGRLAGKIVSGIGFAELAFLKRDGHGWLPLEAGECTLSTLAQASAVSLISAGSEGHAAGEPILLSPLGGAFSTMRDRSFA